MPWCRQLRQLLASKAIGDVHLVTADFGIRFDQPTSGLLDVGVYPLTLASLVYGGKAPVQVVAVGDKTATATATAAAGGSLDTHVAVLLKYGPNQLAQVAFSAIAHTQREAVIVGSKGRIVLRDTEQQYCWHISTEVRVQYTTTEGGEEKEKEQVWQFPLEKKISPSEFNYYSSEMLRYEAEEVMRCLEQGKLQSDGMPLTETVQVLKTMDEIRKQIGVQFESDLLFKE